MNPTDLLQAKLLLSVDEAADVLGFKRSLLYEKLMSGEVQSVKVGRRRLVPVSAVQEYVAELKNDAQL